MKYITIIFFLCIGFSINGQEVGDVKLRRQFGFDANSLNRLLPLEYSIGDPAPFLLHYIKFKDDTKYTVYGLNVDLYGRLRFSNTSSNSDFFSLSAGLKYGKGRVFDNWKKFYFHTGINHTLQFGYSLTTQEETSEGSGDANSNHNRSIQYGIGPFIGLEYRFNDKFSIYTQLRYQVGLEFENEIYKNDLSSAFTRKTSSLYLTDRFYLPTWLAIYYSF